MADPDWLPEAFVGPGSLPKGSNAQRDVQQAAHERTKQVGHYVEMQKSKHVEIAERTGRFSVTFTTGAFSEGTSSILIFESPGINAGRKYLQRMGDIFARAVYPAARDMDRRIREVEEPGSTAGMTSPWENVAGTESEGQKDSEDDEDSDDDDEIAKDTVDNRKSETASESGKEERKVGAHGKGGRPKPKKNKK
jgi:hypothetical protein